MATTTNYNWTTPDDTALVKDGAAAIRTLGSSADTTVKALNPGTTAGDVDYYTTSTAKARLGIGTAGQVLTVNSGATAPEWATISAGGLTLISTTTLSGATTTISGISGSYNTLYVIITGVSNATATGNFRIAPNGSTTITSFRSIVGDSTNANQSFVGNYLLLFGSGGAQRPLFTSTTNAYTVVIDNYASSTAIKPFEAYGIYENNAGDGVVGAGSFGGINTTSAITSLVFSNSGGNLSTGTVLLYGVK